jgi:hypothetical protein
MVEFKVLVPCSGMFHETEFGIGATGLSVLFNPCDTVPDSTRAMLRLV